MATLFRVQRLDGYVLRFTDHDRTISQGGETYSPANLASVSAERREAGLRTGNQEATGIVDGSTITIPDLLGDRYRGAAVTQQIVDWAMPWLVYYRARKVIRQIKWDGSRYVAVIEGQAAKLQRKVGGRFGGIYSTTCTYTLGDPVTCKKDISADVRANVVVETVQDDRMQCRFTTASWTGTFTDDYFRDGEIEWTVGDNLGVVSPIVRYIHSNRECQFLFPTPFPIQAGDEGTARPGCDGLKTTCIDKFNNVLNFGGSPYDPGAQRVLESTE